MSDKEQTIEFMQKNIATANDRISTLLNMKANRELHHYEWKWEKSWCAVELDRRNREVSFFETAITALKSQSVAEQKIDRVEVIAKIERTKIRDGHYSGMPTRELSTKMSEMLTGIIAILEGD